MTKILKLGENLILDEVCRICRGTTKIANMGDTAKVVCPNCKGLGVTLTEAGKTLCLLVGRHLYAVGQNAAMPNVQLPLMLKTGDQP